MLPQLTSAERKQINTEKREKILNLLADFEVYTSASNAAELINLSRARAVACLKSMEKEKLIKSETVNINARDVVIYGITPHGLAYVNAAGNPHFEAGRNSPTYANHKLDIQRMRIKAQAHGWTNWQSERKLRIDNPKLKKIPDATAKKPNGAIVAIEIERYSKTPKQYAEILSQYLLEFGNKNYSEVHYLSPKGVSHLIKNAFLKVSEIRFEGEIKQVPPQVFNLVKFFEYEEWLTNEK